MFRFTTAIALLLLLATAAVGVAAQDAAPKTVQGQAVIHDLGCVEPPCEGSTWQVDFTWAAPQPAPDGYRLDYAVNGQWRSYKRANTPSKGTIFITAEEHAQSGGHDLRGIQVPYGKTMCFRVKARYHGEKDGPWTKLCV